MKAPHTVFWSLKWISIHLPKREELLFLTVFALPKDSRIGLVYVTHTP